MDNGLVNAPAPTLPDEFDCTIGLTLADAIREGAKHTKQTVGWGNGSDTACALTAAGLTIENLGYGIQP